MPSVAVKVSIIIPVIRPESARRCVEAIRRNAGPGLEPEADYEILAEPDTNRIGCPRMVKRLTARSRGEMVLFLGDDTLPQNGFLAKALEAMASLPGGWGMVGLNDRVHDGNHTATHWMCHKKLLPLLGGEFFHTGYLHTRCDRELTERCQALGRYVWAEEAVLEHAHPSLQGRELTGDYRRVYSVDYLKHDRALYKRRKAAGWPDPPPHEDAGGSSILYVVPKEEEKTLPRGMDSAAWVA
ncbi:MAG: hypothetical protein GF355_16720 [Candidatus Eisenbacteria bacterium]|nr:hypothetical protein [Candidatus Eisenbacteria bacterium]